MPVLAPMFPHWTFPNSSKDSLTTAAKALPEFDGISSHPSFQRTVQFLFIAACRESISGRL